MDISSSVPQGLRPIDRLLGPFLRFAKLEAAGGIVLMAATLAGLFVANTTWAGWYREFLHGPISVGFWTKGIERPLHFWINDGCMALFFLLVGLEIKREFVSGELSSMRRATLPIVAAIGGVIAPASIYSLFNYPYVTAQGWGIPIATDIAFSLAILTLLGKRVPTTLKVFLAAFAIADDIAGIIVIASAYTGRINLIPLTLSILCFGACLGANLMGVTRLTVYLGMGGLLWLSLLGSGIHATLAGLLVAFAVPCRSFMDPQTFVQRGRLRLGELESALQEELQIKHIRAPLHLLERGLELALSPLDRLESRIHPWVSFLIVPLFAFANAGIPVTEVHREEFFNPVFLGIYLGLLVGKPLGITLASWLFIRLHLASLPANVSFMQLHAVSWLGGIGFTISIFIANLAFGNSEMYFVSRIAILAVSATAAVIGVLLLVGVTEKRKEKCMSSRRSRSPDLKA